MIDIYKIVEYVHVLNKTSHFNLVFFIIMFCLALVPMFHLLLAVCIKAASKRTSSTREIRRFQLASFREQSSQ